MTFQEYINDVRTEVGEWSEENFGDQPSVNPLRGIHEEGGELVHSQLKIDQGIREGEEGVGTEAEKDAFGDMAVYLFDYMYREDLEFLGLAYYEYGSELEGWKEATRQYSRLVTAHDSEHIDSKVAANDFFSALDGWCRASGYDFKECIDLAWYDEVKDREWDSNYAE